MSQKAMLIEEKKKYFKSLLTQTLDGLLTKREKTPSGMIYSKDESGDFTDQAPIETDSTLNFRIRERNGRLIAKISYSLRRLENGTFGICEECRGKISEKRLRVRPTATLCIKCKEKEEAEEKASAL